MALKREIVPLIIFGKFIHSISIKCVQLRAMLIALVDNVKYS